MQKVCAYCGEEGKLTREHVWPAGINVRTPEMGNRYFEKAHKVLSAEHTIKDVCAKCNNEVLSKLDDYGCSLFDRYFYDANVKKGGVNFRYDYHRLSRWLLKISYNSSRTVDIDTEHLKRCVPYILGRERTIQKLKLFASLVEPYYDIDERGQPRALPCQGVRSGRVGDLGVQNPPFIVRLVAFNAFYFFIVLTKEHEVENFRLIRSALKGRQRQIPSARRSVQIPLSGLDTKGAWSNHFEGKDALYEEHFARKRVKEGSGGAA